MESTPLATIEKITHAYKHPNADSLIILRVLGYNVIINMNNFPTGPEVNNEYPELIGTKGVMILIDSVIPERLSETDTFSYLRGSHMGKRVRTLKLRDVISQGLFICLDTAKPLLNTKDMDLCSLEEGHDLTQELDLIKYYEIDDNEAVDSCIRGPSVQDPLLAPFPTFLNKTDLYRLQTKINLLKGMGDREFVVTIKVDGQSSTFFYDHQTDRSGMCSKNNLLLLDTDGNTTKSCSSFLVVCKKYNILEKLKAQGESLAVQGETFGPKINNNRAKMPSLAFNVFKISRFDSVKCTFNTLSHIETLEYCNKLGLPHVPIVIPPTKLSELEYDTIDKWVKLASIQKYDAISPMKGLYAEGIVVKTTDDIWNISCKVISPEYLVKYSL